MDKDEEMLAFIGEVQEMDPALEFKVTLHSDGTQLATPGFIEEQDFIKQENRRKAQERKKTEGRYW
jgi:hypothetical protein